MPVVSLDRKQISALKFQAARGKPYAERVSIALAFRLLGITKEPIDSSSILDEIDYLERLSFSSKTKKESQFKSEPLSPLWHKHFSTARHIPANLRIRWNLGDGGNKDLSKLIAEVARDHGDNPDIWPAVLAHKLVIEAYEDRHERGLTGDWIIYGKHEGQNYYLDIATHAEGKGESAHGLYEKLRKGCSVDFPFIFS